MHLDPGTMLYYLTFLPSMVVAITCHEFAHAWIAWKLGDSTAYANGRVTLNPLAHLDPIGTIGLVLVGFGWGRPVPVDVTRLRHPKADLLVSAAGPATNFALAALAALPLRSPTIMQGLGQLGVGTAALVALPMFIHINLLLAVFNILPIGPLDGSHVVESLLPFRQGLRLRQFNRAYGTLIMILLILSGYLLPVSILSLLLRPAINAVTHLLIG